MKKITAILVACMAFVMLTAAVSPVMGAGEQIHGYTVTSFDGTGRLITGDTPEANITLLAADGAIAVSNGTGFQDDGADYQRFSWDGSQVPPVGWDPAAPPLDTDVLFVSEHQDGYFWAAQRTADSASVADPQIDLFPQYEEIAVAYESEVGGDYFTIEIETPKFTDYSMDTDAPVMGTYDLFVSYAVFLTDDGGATWAYQGNTIEVAGTYDDPIIPDPMNPTHTDPATVTTGIHEFNATGLGPGTYNVAVLVNLDSAAPGGYDGGLDGGYTTFGFGAASADIIIEDEVPEFGPGMIVPVVAIIGMFVAFTVYRRKKEE